MALQDRFSDVVAALGIPGAAIAVLHNGDLTTAAAGVVNADTRIVCTDDTLFMIGSVTKAITAGLIRQLAGEGLVDIEAPVTRYLPDLRLAGRPASGALTVRHLLDHSGGLDGDFFADTGRNADALAKYVEACADLALLAAPGRHFSYCNAGYSLLGRIAEIVTGETWDDVVRRRALAPAGAGPVATLPEEMLKHRAAIGHIGGRVVERATLPRSLGPAGFTLAMTATGLVRFMAHEGKARPLGEASITLPDGDHWGLGWKIRDMGGVRLVGHDGGAAGQGASLWAAPDHDVFVAVTHNGDGGALFDRLVLPLLDEVTGCGKPALPDALPKGTIDLAPYAGIYENVGMRLRIGAEDGRLNAIGEHLQLAAPPADFQLDPIDETRFLAFLSPETDPIVMAFLDPDARGIPRIFWAGRLYPRVGDA